MYFLLQLSILSDTSPGLCCTIFQPDPNLVQSQHLTIETVTKLSTLYKKEAEGIGPIGSVDTLAKVLKVTSASQDFP
jgi:hypothetical protein